MASKTSNRSQTFTHAELDAVLDAAAEAPEQFDRLAEGLIAKLDRGDHGLEIRDPQSWRKPARETSSLRPSFPNQFRADVESITILDREDEARLARRIEFARLRLRKARREAGLPEGEVLEGIGWNGQSVAGTDASGAEVLPPRVLRRSIELHALRTEMVERNLYLVLINVERYTYAGASRTDLIQEGSVALFRAVDGFDWRRGLLFRTYAVHWLNQAFRNYIYNFNNTVRVPVYLQKALKHVQQAQVRLGDAQASAEQIAESAELTPAMVEAAIAAARTAYSMDAGSSSDGEGGRLRDLLVQDDEGPYSTRLEQVSLEDGLTRALDKLSERERLVVELRFGIHRERECTLAEVAEQLGVSVERVRQIQMRALSKLNTPGLRRELDPFLN